MQNDESRRGEVNGKPDESGSSEYVISRVARKNVSRNQIGFLLVFFVFMGPSLMGVPSLLREIIFREPSCTFSAVTAAEAQLNTLKVALTQFKTLNRRLPSNEEGLAALVNPPASARVKRSLTTSSAIMDPWGKPYQYRTSYDSDTSAHVLWSFGPDGLDGTEDDITLRHESTVPRDTL